MGDTHSAWLLCYVEGCFAYFCDKLPHKVWGDDWNDAPHDCNAGTPYDDYYKVAFDGPFEVQYKPYASVEQINRNEYAWLYDWRGNRIAEAGVTLDEFIALIEANGGTVYLPSLTEEGEGK